jgi:5-methylcytosine-specific restriction protein B
MQTQFQYIVDLAKKYHEYSEQSTTLYKAINDLPQDIIQDIYKEYGDPDNKFQPVNLLRAEVARELLNGITITEDKVEEIKTRIRQKDKNYFPHLSADFLMQLETYAIGKRDMFASWQRPWSVFHTFFYRLKWGKEKETVHAYLQQICIDLQRQLDIPDYTIHWVDFNGPSNFGSDWCWLALYPLIKDSHRDAYQFFVLLSFQPEAGRLAGFSLRGAKPNSLRQVKSYDEAVAVLKEVSPGIIKLNKESRNFFKLAPGPQASEWTNFYNEKIAALGFSNLNLGDISKYNSKEELNLAAGLPAESESNQTWNLWLFKSANKGDVVFANKGVNACIGIGIIEGSYYYDEKADGYKSKRKINWITDKVYQYKPNSHKNYKTLFRPDTFSPTKVWSFLLSEYARLYPELIPVFEKYHLEYDSTTETSPTVSEPNAEYGDLIDEENKEINFWWLNANPKIWEIGKHNEGQLQTYTTHNEKGNKRRIYKYFEEAKPGDLMIGYESTPTKQIKAIYEITKGIHNTEKEEEIEFELIEKLENPVHWNELKNNPALQKCEVFINNQGSLFRLTEEEYDIIREAIDNKNIITQILTQDNSIKSYKFTEDGDKPFVSENDFLQTVELLKRKKNIILQGPPGVGKTFIARKLAYEIMKEVKDGNIEMVQFHQSYSYEDFIQGIRPTLKGSFDLRDGIFYSFCKRALSFPDRPFFFIIDEINRGNLSKIFGELLMLIESDKRDEKFALKLAYSEEDDDKFYVPENIHIIGTMNTADRSLAIVDYALRRRFAFINLQPDYGVPFRTFLSDKGVTNGLIEHICSAVQKVNNKIKVDNNLGDGFQIGHSYFCSFKTGENENVWWNQILTFEIRPLLEEIWFDDSTSVTEMLKQLSR